MIRSTYSKGFSLLELLIYIGILSLMSVILATSFVSLSRGRAQSVARSEVESSARFVLERLSQDILASAAVSTPTLGVPSNSLVLSVSGSSVVYDVASGVLRRTVDGGAAEPVTGSAVLVDTPAFTGIENYNPTLDATTTAIQIELTVRSSSLSAEGAHVATFRAAVDIR